MSLETAFLQEIAEKPDDAVSRYAYADWLDEQGRDARAEFIRVQMERDRAAGDARRDELARREAELLRDHAGEWLGAMAERMREWRFAGGMLDYVRIDATMLADRYEDLLRLGPVPRVSVVVPPGDRHALIRFTRCPLVRRIKSLTVEGVAGPAEVMALGQGEPFERLQMLCLSRNPLGPDGATALAASPLMANVWLLQVRETGLGPTGVERLAKSPCAAGLRSLDVSANRLGTMGAQMLAGAGSLVGLRTLSVGENGLDAAGARSLAAAPFARTLAALDLTGNPVGCDGLEALAARGAMPALDLLNLTRTNQTLSSGGLVARSPFFTRLRCLYLRGNRLGVRGVADLVSQAPPKAVAPLETLGLSDNGVGDEGAKALAAWPSLAKLHDLDLAGNGLKAFGLRPLVDSPFLKNLRRLDLAANDLGRAGAQILARWEGLGRLGELDLTSNGIDDVGLAELMASKFRREGSTWDLSGNVPGEAAMAAIRAGVKV